MTGGGTSPELVQVGGSCGERVGASPRHHCYLTSAGCGALGQTQSKDHVRSMLTIPCAPFGGGHGAWHEPAVQHMVLGIHPRGLRSEAGWTRGPGCPTAAAMTAPAQEEPVGSAHSLAVLLRTLPPCRSTQEEPGDWREAEGQPVGRRHLRCLGLHLPVGQEHHVCRGNCRW